MLIPTCLIKLVELTLTIVCLVMHCYSYDLTDVKTLIFCSGTYVGYTVVLIGELIGELILSPLDLISDMLYSITAMAMFGCCGGFITYNRLFEGNDLRTGVTPIALSQAGCAMVTVFVFFFDLITACKDVDLDAKRDLEVSTLRREAFLSLADPHVDGCWSAAGGIMFSVCGALTIDHWHSVPQSWRRKCAQVAAGCAICVAGIMGIDALLALVAAHKSSSSERTKSRVDGQC